MYISRIAIRNYRNFRDFDLALAEHAVVVGENAVGKSNLFCALGLILDPGLPDSDRELRDEDFWDGYTAPRVDGVAIQVSIELSGFGSTTLTDRRCRALLADYLVVAEPPVARLAYVYRPRADLIHAPASPADYEFLVYGGSTREDARFDHHVRRRVSLEVFGALRDAEHALANWRRSPLRPLLVEVLRDIPMDRLRAYASAVDSAAKEVTDAPEIRALADTIMRRVARMVGDASAMRTTLGLTPADPDSLFRSLRIFVDERVRDVSEASLGSANILYLALVSLGLERAAAAGDRTHTVLGVEEPEAHLHPHFQRLVYRDFLRRRAHQNSAQTTVGDRSARGDVTEQVDGETVSKILTTHSPHIVSVSPVRSLALLRRNIESSPESGFDQARTDPSLATSISVASASSSPSIEEEEWTPTAAPAIRPGTPSTIGRSTALLSLTPADEVDLERYLDVSRGEIVFARGVVLVEGDAEAYVLPVLAIHCGHDLDRLGVSVCSIAGTHFAPFLRFLGPKGLDIPTVVLTDWDPFDDPDGDDPSDEDSTPRSDGAQAAAAPRPSYGARRLATLLASLEVPDAPSTTEGEALRSRSVQAGIYTNSHTLEVDLFHCSSAEHIAAAMADSGAGARSRARVDAWVRDPSAFNARRFLRDINAIGKGRVAQALAKRLAAITPTEASRALVPRYIAAALDNLVSRLPRTFHPTGVTEEDPVHSSAGSASQGSRTARRT